MNKPGNLATFVAALGGLATVALAPTALAAPPTKGPVKVYILAGQSNMEGQAKVETFDYIGDDPSTAPLLKEMRGPDGKPRVCENVWISYLTGSKDNNGEGLGKLTAGYGSRYGGDIAELSDKIGPEFTFGITASKAYYGPILIIKTAWGGKSLNTDFRPPSAGPYKFSDNKGGHPNLTETLKVFRNRINTKFIIGVGDHFGSEGAVQSMEKSAVAA